MPVLGWVSKDGTSCSYPSSTYPQQVSFDPYRPASATCGNGLYPNGSNGCTSTSGCNITDPTGEAAITSTSIDPPTWASAPPGSPTSSAKFRHRGQRRRLCLRPRQRARLGGTRVHRDVHPVASTYDEVTINEIATARAVKTADPTALVNGPVVDNWWNYFYSKKDMENGWSTGPCYQPWAGPVDRTAHGGVPFIEYYLQQMSAASNTYGARLLDYLDLHTYYAATYTGSGVGLNTAGDTGAQQARLNSTRVFWDPTYTDPNEPQPNYTTDPNYTASCNVPLQAPQLIPMAQAWIARDYPGTKLAFSEYNWGGQENINGAVAQADILGIFGSYGLDTWPPLLGPARSNEPGPRPHGIRNLPQLRRQEVHVRQHVARIHKRQPGHAFRLLSGSAHLTTPSPSSLSTRPTAASPAPALAPMEHCSRPQPPRSLISTATRRSGHHCRSHRSHANTAIGKLALDHRQLHLPGPVHHAVRHSPIAHMPPDKARLSTKCTCVPPFLRLLFGARAGKKHKANQCPSGLPIVDSVSRRPALYTGMFAKAITWAFKMSAV